MAQKEQDVGGQVVTAKDFTELLRLLVKGDAMILTELRRINTALSPPVEEEQGPRRVKLRDLTASGPGKRWPKPGYITEQYRFVERKKMSLTTDMSYYQIVTPKPFIALLITDSIIQWDWAPITSDSPVMSGSSANLANITLGIEKLKRPVKIWAATLAGTGNLWIVVGE